PHGALPATRVDRAPRPVRGSLFPAVHPARESQDAPPAQACAEGAIPPRNLSGARTVRSRQLWRRRDALTEGEGWTRLEPEESLPADEPPLRRHPVRPRTVRTAPHRS